MAVEKEVQLGLERCCFGIEMCEEVESIVEGREERAQAAWRREQPLITG